MCHTWIGNQGLRASQIFRENQKKGASRILIENHKTLAYNHLREPNRSLFCLLESYKII
jgi:hypothetical protein